MQYFSTTEDLEIVLMENIIATYEKHNHTSKYIFGMVLEGEIWIENQRGKRRYTKNDFFTIPIYQVHELAIANKETRVLTFCIGRKFFQEYLEEQDKAFCFIDEYLKLLNRQKIINNGQMKAFSTGFSEFIQRYFMNKDDGYNTSLVISEDIAQIKNLLEEEPEKERTLEQLSDEFYLSKYYLLRKFKEQIGLPPHRFQIQNRIRKVQRLLEEGWSTVAAANEMEFYDQSHFQKHFQKVVKMTPGAYVKVLKRLG